MSGRPSRIAAPARPCVDGELEVEQRLVEAVHRDAPEDTALAVEEVAVGGVGVEQVADLVDEPLRARTRSRARSSATWAALEQRRLLASRARSRRAGGQCEARVPISSWTVSTSVCSLPARGRPHVRRRHRRVVAVDQRRRSHDAGEAVVASSSRRDAHERRRDRAPARRRRTTPRPLACSRSSASGESGGGAQPFKRDCRLGVRPPEQQRELPRRESALRVDRREREHPEHALLGDHRDPAAALGSRRARERAG